MPRWKIERVLIDQLADPFLEHDTAMIAIAAAFGTPGCARDLSDWLDHAARPLFTSPEDLSKRAAALTSLITNQLCLRVRTDHHQALLLDQLIASQCGHPILLASVGHELARRAGWPTVTATAQDGHYVTVLTGEGYFAPIAYGIPLRDAAQLRACCAHTITAATLAEITRHAPADLAASASRVRDALSSTSHHNLGNA